MALHRWHLRTALLYCSPFHLCNTYNIIPLSVLSVVSLTRIGTLPGQDSVHFVHCHVPSSWYFLGIRMFHSLRYSTDIKGVTNHMDDEYRWAGVEDPKVMITTSRDPSSRLKMFAKELKLVFPGAQRMNRGRHEVGALVRACKANGVTDLLVVHEHRGTPVGFIVSHLPFGPTAYFTLCNVVMRHDIPDLGTVSEAKPHLIMHGFSSRLGKRVSDILRYLFPVPKDDSHRVITFANQDDYISFRHHVYRKTNHRSVELTEVGPRFELKLYMIRLGTLEQEATADVEWRWHPYTNTARKRVFLSAE
uniref:Brix domain-containing protein n=1 Tax=Felis catus TaxID=9685 RepID=A0ABI7Z6K8_FELCA